jgi:hypothetical protein
MKNKYSLLAFFALSLLLGINQETYASINEEAISKSFKEKGINGLCKKANASSGSFSLRSFDGVACSKIYIGALAEMICPGIDGYENSGCHAKAVAALKGQVALVVLKGAIQKGMGPAKTLVCPNIDKFPGALKSKLAGVCS